jgi:hypothetical protein
MHATRDQLPILFGTDAGGIRGVDWGDLRCTIVSIPASTEVTPLLKGLPGDRCPCPHWGYVLKGEMRVAYIDRQETVRAGELFYMPPGHTLIVEQDVEYVEFSPPGPYDEFMETARRNAATAKAS